MKMKIPSCSLLKLLCVVLPLRTSYSLGLTNTADCGVHPEDDDCFRREQAPNAYTYRFATKDEKGSFRPELCLEYPGCYQKTPCKDNSRCYKWVTCSGEQCYNEISCTSECVRHENVKEGIKYVGTTGRGFVFSQCPSDEECLEKTPCDGFVSSGCRNEEKCIVSALTKTCIKETKCHDECVPTYSPSTSSSKSPTSTSPTSTSPSTIPTYSKSPTSTSPTSTSPSTIPTYSPSTSPSTSPTSTSPTRTFPTSPSPSIIPTAPWKCDGCEWMDKQSKQEVGDELCSINIKLKVRSKNGKCEGEEDGKDCNERPCNYGWRFNWKIDQECTKNCKLIVVDPLSITTYFINKKKGKEKESNIKVECFCGAIVKLFTFQCTKDDDTFSKSIKLDYACTKCDKKQFAELKAEL